jgi:hypothetical protein
MLSIRPIDKFVSMILDPMGRLVEKQMSAWITTICLGVLTLGIVQIACAVYRKWMSVTGLRVIHQYIADRVPVLFSSTHLPVTRPCGQKCSPTKGRRQFRNGPAFWMSSVGFWDSWLRSPRCPCCVRCGIFVVLRILLFCWALGSCVYANDRQGQKYNCLDGVKTIAIQDLPAYADGVQLEGGYVYKKLNHEQRYANVSVVWDTPFHNLEATEAFAHGTEKFRESRIEQYNEHQVISLISNLMLYYFKQSTPNQKTIFCFYIGKRSSLNLFEIVEKVLKKYDSGLRFREDSSSDTRIGWISDMDGRNMEVITHYRWLNSNAFQGADLVVGFSWNGGFNQEYKSGDFLVPTQFIDISKGKKFSLLFLNDKYMIKNDFNDNLSKFIAFQDQGLVDIVNEEFVSENAKKASQKARILHEDDFYKDVTLLGTWEIFEPGRWPANVVIPE